MFPPAAGRFAAARALEASTVMSALVSSKTPFAVTVAECPEPSSAVIVNASFAPPADPLTSQPRPRPD